MSDRNGWFTLHYDAQGMCVVKSIVVARASQGPLAIQSIVWFQELHEIISCIRF